MEVNDDLNLITCNVDTPYHKHQPFTKRAYIAKKLTKEVGEDLEAQGLNVRAPILIMPRGAGYDTFLSLLKMLLSAKDIIGVLSLVFGSAIKIVKKLIGTHYSDSELQLDLCLSIRSDKFVTSENFWDDLNSRMKQLNIIARAEANELEKRYTLYKFATAIVVSINENGFNATYTEDGNISRFNHKRMTNVIAGLRFQPGMSLNVSLLKSGFIKHECNYSTEILNSPYSQHDWRIVKKQKVIYYTLFSNKIVGGYKRKKLHMDWADYEKKFLNS